MIIVLEQTYAIFFQFRFGSLLKPKHIQSIVFQLVYVYIKEVFVHLSLPFEMHDYW